MVVSVTREDTAMPRSLDEVPGWFARIDQRLFTWIFELQERTGLRGDVVELGAYMGKSAVLIGRHLRAGETLTVCDLFEEPAPDAANKREMTASYAHLTRDRFEANYRAFHAELPTVIQGPTSVILDHVQPATCRFVHVDASHLYDHVAADIAASRVMLVPGGIVACDDYRTEHTPGVAAAVWEAVLNQGLEPICLTRQKLYGTWGDSGPLRAELTAWLATQDRLWHETQQVAGREIIRVRESTSQQRAADTNELEDQRLAWDLATVERQLADTRRQLARLRASRSFRIGRALTAPARALRRLVR